MGHIVGALEAGGTKFNCAIIEAPNRIIREVRIATRSPQETLGEALEFFRSSDVALVAIGVSCFGPIELCESSPLYGYITTTPKMGWRNTDVVGALRELNVPVGFDTDVNGAALGEYTCGAGKDLSSLVYYTIGTGIGGGAIVNGEPLHGLSHPEMGHCFIPHDRLQDPFPGCCPYHSNCFEGLASGPAIEQRWKVSPATLPEDHPAWDLESHYIALALANTVLTLSPQRIIIGGGVMSNRFLFPHIRHRLASILNRYVDRNQLLADIDSYIVPTGLGDKAGVIGAAVLALRSAALGPTLLP
jgi:fructokinase